MLLLLVALLAPGTLQAPGQPVDVTYLREMPTVEQVLAAIQGKGPLDTPARQGAAFRHLKEMLYLYAQGRRYTNRLTPSEQAMVQRYDSGYAQVVGPIIRRYDPKLFRQTPALEAERARFYQLLTAYEVDRALVDELLKKRFSKGWRRELERLAEERAELAAETSRRRAQGDMRPVSSAGLALERQFAMVRWSMIGGVALVAALLLLLEFGGLTLTLDDPPRLKVGPRHYQVHGTIGEVKEAKKWSETHVSSSGGGTSYTPDGYATARPVTVSSTVVTRDEIILREPDGKERALQLANVDLPVGMGQTLAAVWLIRRGKERGPYVLFHNFSMDDTRFVDGEIYSAVRVRMWPLLPVAATAWLLTYSWVPTGGAAAVFLVLGWLMASYRTRRVKRELGAWVKAAGAEARGSVAHA